MSMRTNKWQFKNGLVIALFVAMVVPAFVWAQPAPPPTPSFEERARKKSTLDRESKEVADEYADILVELQSLVADYHEYLTESESPTIIKYLNKLDKIGFNLDHRVYVRDRNKLVEDLTMHVAELEKIETYIEESEEIFPVRILKVVGSLRRDLENLNDLLQDDLVERMDNVRANEDALSQAIEELLAEIKVEHGHNFTYVTVPKIDEKKIEALQKEAELMAKQAQKEAAKAEKVQKTVKVKTPAPGAPVVIALDDLPNAFSFGSGTTKEIEDTLSVTNPKLPIRIQSQLGEVVVTGSASKQIIARLSAEIAADSRTQEKKLLSEIDLKLEATPSGYLITATAPTHNRDGENCRIISNNLEIMLPSSNPVEVTCAFGSVSARDLNGGIQTASEYSQVEIEDVKGGVQVTSNMGGIGLISCSGPFRISNAYAPITIEDCSGQFDIQNSYSEIGLEDCTGNTTIRNSGSISISNHTGDMRISNSFGPIEIDGLSGNLSAANQFSPLSVQNIKGTVVVENANANIDLTNIMGKLSATNKFGQISAEQLAGQFNLASQNGNIFVVLGDSLRGSSWVSTTFGNVDVIIPEESNFWVKAKTTFGDIHSDFPLKLDDLGNAKSGWLKLGKASDSLSINGQNTVITISGSK